MGFKVCGFRLLTGAVLTGFLISCGGGGGGGGGGGNSLGPAAPAESNPPSFAGLSGVLLVPGDEGLELEARWQDVPTDDRDSGDELKVELFLSNQPFDQLAESTASSQPVKSSRGNKGRVVVNLSEVESVKTDPGSLLYVRARAKDSSQNSDDNEVSLVVQVPANTYYVDAAGDEPGEGTKDAPFTSLRTAITEAGLNGGGSILIAEGTYEGDIRIADPMQLFGGFPRSFSRSKRDPKRFPTIVSVDAGDIAFTIGKETRVCMDGLVLETAHTGISVESPLLQVTNCEFPAPLGLIVRALWLGGPRLDFRGELTWIGNIAHDVREEMIGGSASLIRCQILNNQTMGRSFGGLNLSTYLAAEAKTTVRIENNEFADNIDIYGYPGIELRFINDSGPDLGLDCLIQNNRVSGGSIGVGVDGYAQPDGPSRVSILDNEIVGSMRGIQAYPGQTVANNDCRVDIRGNEVEFVRESALVLEATTGRATRTRMSVIDNILSGFESTTFRIVGQYARSSIDEFDEGTFEIEVLRNTVEANSEFSTVCFFDLPVTHGGRTTFSCRDNTFCGRSGHGMDAEFGRFLGDSSSWDGERLDGDTFLTFANNLFESAYGSNLRRIEEDPTRIFALLTENTFLEGHRNLRVELMANSSYTGLRNVFGEANSDAALAMRSWIPGKVILQNELLYRCFGDGLRIEGEVAPQMFNSTVYRATQSSGRAGVFHELDRDQDSPAYLLNSVFSNSRIQNLASEPFVNASYSLIPDRDRSEGQGNQNADPRFMESDDEASAETFYALRGNSPARNAGRPGPDFADRDGSRNDMGHLGGPASGPMGARNQSSPEPFVLVGTWPPLGLETGVDLMPTDASLELIFSAPVNPDTLSGTVRLEGSQGKVRGKAKVRKDNPRIVDFDPSGDLPGGERLELRVATDLTSTSGQSLDHPVLLSFPTISAPIEPSDVGFGSNAMQLSGQEVYHVSTRLSGTDPDEYVLNLAAGDRLQATLFAVRELTGLAPILSLELYDVREETKLFTAPNLLRSDPLLDFTASQDGEYLLSVRGAGSMSYRLVAVVEPQ